MLGVDLEVFDQIDLILNSALRFRELDGENILKYGMPMIAKELLENKIILLCRI